MANNMFDSWFLTSCFKARNDRLEAPAAYFFSVFAVSFMLFNINGFHFIIQSLSVNV